MNILKKLFMSYSTDLLAFWMPKHWPVSYYDNNLFNTILKCGTK